jgi:dipeptidyl aminopeptidase/acylaminoacyl peptidase
MDNPLQELPDGSAVLVQSNSFDAMSQPNLVLYNYAAGSFSPVRDSPAYEGDGSIAPDGNWIAYVSDESGRAQVYVGPLGAKGPNVQVSSIGGNSPRFSRDGKRLFFRDSQDVLMAVTVEFSGTEPRISMPSKVFDVKTSGPFATIGWAGYEPLPEGGFLMVERAAWEKEPPVIHVVLNWALELTAGAK